MIADTFNEPEPQDPVNRGTTYVARVTVSPPVYITVDATGRITAAANGPVTGPITVPVTNSAA